MDAVAPVTESETPEDGTLKDGLIDRSVTDWYKDAIIYQLHIKAFLDADNNGYGDFRGLMEKLDYVAGARRHRDLAAAVLPLARCATTGTTSPTTRPSTRSTATSRRSRSSCGRRTRGGCASSPSS